MQRGDEGNPEQIFAFAAFQVAQKQPQQHQAPKDDKYLITGIAAVEQDKG